MAEKIKELDEVDLWKQVEILKQDLKQKISVKDLLNVLGLFLLAFSLTIALVTGTIVSVTQVPTIQAGPFIISTTLILAVVTFVIIGIELTLIFWYAKTLAKSRAGEVGR